MFEVAEVHLALNRNSHGDAFFEDALELQKQRNKDKDENYTKYYCGEKYEQQNIPLTELLDVTPVPSAFSLLRVRGQKLIFSFVSLGKKINRPRGCFPLRQFIVYSQ